MRSSLRWLGGRGGAMVPGIGHHGSSKWAKNGAGAARDPSPPGAEAPGPRRGRDLVPAGVHYAARQLDGVAGVAAEPPLRDEPRAKPPRVVLHASGDLV